MNLPPSVEYVIKQVKNHGGQAYLVGGALRDQLLGSPVMDYDIAVSLYPEEVTALFSHHKTWSVGKRYGTIIVEVEGTHLELTTFRQEAAYSDSRHPDRVSFVSDIRMDLARRDFTINAMAWNPFDSQGLIDPFQGREDLAKGMIRAVGSPLERFEEDPLRILRGVRFSAQLGFTIHEDTKKAMTASSELLKKVSKERLREELSKLLLASNPEKGILALQESGVLFILFPLTEKKIRIQAVLNDRNTQVIKELPKALPVRLAALISLLLGEEFNYTTEMDGVKKLLDHLKYDKKTKSKVMELLQGYCEFQSGEPTFYAIRKLVGEIGVEAVTSVLDWASKVPQIDHSSQAGCETTALSEKTEQAKAIIFSILDQKSPVFFHQLAVTGDDIIKAGIGKDHPRQIGEALRLAYDWVLKEPNLNNKPLLMDMLLKHYHQAKN